MRYTKQIIGEPVGMQTTEAFDGIEARVRRLWNFGCDTFAIAEAMRPHFPGKRANDIEPVVCRMLAARRRVP